MPQRPLHIRIKPGCHMPRIICPITRLQPPRTQWFNQEFHEDTARVYAISVKTSPLHRCVEVCIILLVTFGKCSLTSGEEHGLNQLSRQSR